jgi:hypothetical protein
MSRLSLSKRWKQSITRRGAWSSELICMSEHVSVNVTRWEEDKHEISRRRRDGRNNIIYQRARLMCLRVIPCASSCTLVCAHLYAFSLVLVR